MIASLPRCLAIALACSLIDSANAQSLLSNGDFETGALAPWNSTGSVNVAGTTQGGTGQFDCVFSSDNGTKNGGTITQNLATKAGSLYYLAFDASGSALGTVTASAGPVANPGTADGHRTLILPFVVPPDRYSLIFTASTNATTVSIKADLIPVTFASIIIDNVVLIELPPNPHAGRFTGLETTETSNTDTGLKSHASLKVVGRIKPTGQLVMVENGKDVIAGIIFPDDTASLRINGVAQTAQATIKGSRITLKLDSTLKVLDEGSNEISSDQTVTYTLTRVGK